jgi:hypothetical protein
MSSLKEPKMTNSPKARFSQSHEQASECQSAMEWTSHLVDAQPMSAVCAGFATGFLVGMAAVSMMLSGKSQSRPRTRVERFSEQAEQFADQVMRAVASRLPKQLTDWRS